MTYTTIKSKVYLLTKTNSTSFPNADMVIYANTALDRVTSLIMEADGRWEWDDANQTDLPIATTTLTSGQQDYSLATSHLAIVRVEVKDSNSTWHLLKPIDQAAIQSEALTTYQNTDGIPYEYDKIGNSIFLYPAPNFTQAASLKVYFQRGPSAFVAGDTTKEPGFNSLYHDLIPLWIAYEFAIANGRKNANQLFAEIERKEKKLKADYALRNKDERMKMGSKPICFR